MIAVPRFDVYDLRGGSIVLGLPATTVADLLDIDAAELGWCIEEYGRCDVGHVCVVPAESPTPKPLED